MADKISATRRSENMRQIKSAGTKPEMIVRRLVHSLGYRYRLHRRDLPGKPDLVFGPRKKVIFVHGCFWHQHADASCVDSRLPKSNPEYWTKKLQRNVQRDRENRERLEAAGWQVHVIWECELDNLDTVSARVTEFLDS